MTLQEWLTAEGVTPRQFSERVGVATRSVYRYLSGDTHPVPRIMVRIQTATGGKVTAADFYK